MRSSVWTFVLRMSSVSSTIESVSSSFKDFKPEDDGGGDAEPLPSTACAPESESELVGTAKPKADIIHLLGLDAADLAGKENAADLTIPPLQVITILGRRGLGKTALARVVYDHCRASGAYGLVAWVSASGCRDSNALLEKVLASVRAEASSMDADLKFILHNKW